ncbi:MAG: protease-like activity factor CPAF [Elusimicrobia bacterium]|nr:protease-like activity factor CPAF [Elusimicrobiota bacterium]
MRCFFRRCAAATLAALIACPAPQLWAANIAAPSAVRTGPAGIAAPVTALPGGTVSGMSLAVPGSLAAPSLQGALRAVPQVSPSAMLIAPLAAPAIGESAPTVSVPLSRILPQSLPAAPEAPAQGQAAAAQKVTGMTHEVMTFLETTGPLGQAAPEQARSTGDKVFKSLLGGPADQDAASLSLAVGAQTAQAPTLTQQKMLHTLYQVAAIFAEQYAPIEEKKDRFQLDLRREYDKAKDAILADPKITTRQFQDLLADLVAGMRDYHVSISFHSTERARLPFLVTGAGGKYFIAYIDRELLPEDKFPVQVGDEVMSFEGQPTAEAVKAIAARLGGNTAETDLRLAELVLTNRRRSRGDTAIPQGDAEFVVRLRDGQLAKVQMPWDYTPEFVPQDVPVRDAGLETADKPAGLLPESGIDESLGATPKKSETLKSLLAKVFDKAVHPLAAIFAEMRSEAADNPFMIGSKKSFVPQLGKTLWEADEENPFHAYVFEAPDGRKMGYVRIASYDGGAKETKAFGAAMAEFNKQGIKGLVIDQVNNPGGSVFHLYALASYLTDKPLKTAHHRLIIGESDAAWAANLLLQIMQPDKAEKKDSKKKKAKADDEDDDGFSGYPVSQKFMLMMVKFAQFILKQFDAGQRFTELTHLWGVDDIDPAPKAEERYTGPILLLTNALDFSGGDFFPALMQDNQRATILGVRTSGAGGAVKPYDLPNQFGIASLAATWTIATRRAVDPKSPNDGQPIENRGVIPDVPYDITEKDMHTGFSEYRDAILKALSDLVGPAAAPAPVQTLKAKPKVKARSGRNPRKK